VLFLDDFIADHDDIFPEELFDEIFSGHGQMMEPKQDLVFLDELDLLLVERRNIENDIRTSEDFFLSKNNFGPLGSIIFVGVTGFDSGSRLDIDGVALFDQKGNSARSQSGSIFDLEAFVDDTNVHKNPPSLEK